MAFFHILPERKDKGKLALSGATMAKLGCHACTLDKAKLIHPKMPATGAEKPVIYMLGEAPGEEEDKEGKQFVGDSGEFIRGRIPSKWAKHIRWDNVLDCRPPNNRTPTPLEINCCRSRQLADILKTKPRIVVALGGIPFEWFTGIGSQIRDIWRGRRMAARLGDHDFWLYPMIHPSFILRMGGELGGAEWARVFSDDLKRIFTDADNDLPDPTIITLEDWRQNIRCWQPGDTVQQWVKLILDFIEKDPIIGHDLESGLNPYAADAAILTASISNGEETLAWPVAHPEVGLSERNQRILMDALCEALRKAKRVIAHNAAHEQEWLTVHGHPNIVHEVNWADTMAQAYTLDERQGAKELEELTLIHFGSRVKAAFNMGNRAPSAASERLIDVLNYNGGDSKACCLLWYVMEEEIKAQKLEAVAHRNQADSGSMALLMAQGVVPHQDNANKLDVIWSGKVKKLADAILALPEVKEYRAKYGAFNPQQPNDIKAVFNRVCGFNVANTKEETLKEVDHPLADLIMEFRTASKNHSTWIRGIVTGAIIEADGKLHGRYKHLSSRSGRTTSDIMQTFPKREHREIRGLIGKPKGYVIASFDWGQIQARNIAMESKDPFLVNAFWTDYDIHSEWTERIAKVAPRWGKNAATNKKVFENKRDHVKNEWTFPRFFGAKLETIAGYLGIDADILAPLYDEFTHQIGGVIKWHEALDHFYAKHLYVENLLGRRRHGPMSPNERIATPIQADEREIVLERMEVQCRLAYEREEPWLYPVMEIHDDLTFYFPEEKAEEAIEITGKNLCTPAYPWINVPLLVECSVSYNAWDELEKIEKFWSHQYGHKRGAAPC